MRRYRLPYPTRLALLCLVLASCSTSEPPKQVVSPPVPISTPPEISDHVNQVMPKLSEQVETSLFSYTSSRRRDPFRSVIASTEKRTRVKGSLPPLQRVETSDMKLVGIITGANGPRAMIKTPDGKGYTVRVGTRVGLSHGVIKKITPGAIAIEETLLNVFGESRKREIVIKLHPQKEGRE